MIEDGQKGKSQEKGGGDRKCKLRGGGGGSLDPPFLNSVGKPIAFMFHDLDLEPFRKQN